MSDYAPLYSKRERIRMVLIALALLVVFYLVIDNWFKPWLEDYISYANCRVYNGYTGVQVLLYAMFVGAPLSMALFFALLFAPYSIRVLKSKQDPPPGDKVLRKTRIRHGKRAMLRPLALLAVIVFMSAAAAWGGVQAEKLSRNVKPCSEEQMLELRHRTETEK